MGLKSFVKGALLTAGYEIRKTGMSQSTMASPGHFHSTIRMSDYLPVISEIPSEFRGGRNVHDGYQRGWGLQFGGLRERVASDEDYRYALRCADGRQWLTQENLMNIFLIIKFYLPHMSFGHIIEFGSYRVGSALFMAALAERFLPGVEVYALDTFTGMPGTDKTVDAHKVGDFANVDFDEVLEAVTRSRLKNIHIVRGLFQDTALTVLNTVETIALCHIDCDIYESVKFAYNVCKSYMIPDGYVVFDDSTMSSCIGATEVVEEFVIRRDGLLSEQIYPHHVFRIGIDTSPKESHD